MKIRTKTLLKNSERKKGGAGNWPVAYRWVALGTLVAYTAVGTKTIQGQDLQQGGASNGSAVRSPSAQVMRRFDIAAGQLDVVLPEFQRATGLSVTVEKQGFGTLASPGV